jgi:type IV pilus assembly protein PilA
MPSFARRTRAGFTLIELMLVVAIVGILAVLAAYGVRKYVANSKTAEARNAIGRMAKAAVIYYEDTEVGNTATIPPGTSTTYLRVLCNKASGPVPVNAASISGKKWQSSVADWNVDEAGNSGFACLKFAIDQAQYYQYSYTVSGTSAPGDSFTCTANGDLDGNGVFSTFQITGSINSSFTVNLAPNMLQVNSEE